MNLTEKKIDSTVIDARSAFELAGTDKVYKAAKAFLKLYRVVGADAAFDLLHKAVHKQLREQVLDLAEQQLEEEELQELRTFLK